MAARSRSRMFGVVEEVAGTGAARALMSAVLDQGFGGGAGRVWLHTCHFDHPAAIPFYRRMGFSPWKFAIEVSRDPRLDGFLPREAGPHVPLIDPDEARSRSTLRRSPARGLRPRRGPGSAGASSVAAPLRSWSRSASCSCLRNSSVAAISSSCAVSSWVCSSCAEARRLSAALRGCLGEGRIGEMVLVADTAPLLLDPDLVFPGRAPSSRIQRS